MIETDDEGNRQMGEVLKNLTHGCFNDWEKNFIKDLRGKRYEELTKKQRAVITRLYDWLNGEP